MVCLNALTRHFQPQAIQARERAQIRAIKDSIGHVEVFQMDGVAISIIGRPRPLPGHDTPNPANNTYTLNYEEPLNAPPYSINKQSHVIYVLSNQGHTFREARVEEHKKYFGNSAVS